ncbi:hypothetical protein [Streptomyces sp. NPDC101206]|uniref:hypothetical protein n=1 Tax=Streptomyces sp. NPDC101206 TaxID=3366128 RepID=UPI003809A3B5
MSAPLCRRGTAHCHVEGDFPGRIHPAPDGDPDRAAITEQDLASVWADYTALGQHRLVYADTVSILDRPLIVRAIGRHRPGRPTGLHDERGTDGRPVTWMAERVLEAARW